MSIDLRDHVALPPSDPAVGSTTHRTGSPTRSATDHPTVPERRLDAPDRRHRLLVVAAVQILCATAAVLLSQTVLVHESLRLDEAQSLFQTDHDYRSMLALVAQDVHVPGYHVILRTWRLVFGLDVRTARELSLTFFVASMPVLYLVARRVLTTRWALLVVVLYSLSPFMNWYANETRMYTMLVLATLISQLCFLRVLERGTWGSWAAYTCSAMAGVYVHYFFVFVLVMQGLFFLVARRRDGWAGVGRMAAATTLVIGALLPWLLYFRRSGAGSGTRPHLASPTSIDFSNVYSQFLFGFQSDTVNSLLLSSWPLLILAGLASVRSGVRMQRHTAYFTLAAFGPVVLAFGASQVITPFFLSRYMIAALPAVLIIGVAFVRILSPRMSAVLVGLAVLATVATTVVEVRSPDVPVKEDYRQAARILDARVTPQDIVVLSSPFTFYPFERYYRGGARVATLPAWDPSKRGGIPAFDAATLPQQVKDLTAGHQRIYLLLSYDQGYETTISDYFRDHFAQIAGYDVSPGMRLVGYRVGYSQLASVDQLQISVPKPVVTPARSARRSSRRAG